jgi:hypothetical protein
LVYSGVSFRYLFCLFWPTGFSASLDINSRIGGYQSSFLRFFQVL